MDKPLLSVCLITYNHGNFIRQAIESVLAQKVNFSWEFIIADDCSTDGTTEILKEYSAKYPQLIKLIIQSPNIGPSENFLQLLTSAQAKYIAYIEGDDYWTNEGKLQKQVDFLENNPDFSMCFHNVFVKYENDLNRSHNFHSSKEDVFTFSDVLNRKFFASGSCVFRNFNFSTIPRELELFDWTLYLFTSQNGKIKIFPDIMGVYRRHSSGWTSSGKAKKLEESNKALRICKNYFDVKYANDFEKIITANYTDAAFEYFQERDYINFEKTYQICLISKHFISDNTLFALSVRHKMSKFKVLADTFNYCRGLLKKSSSFD